MLLRSFFQSLCQKICILGRSLFYFLNSYINALSLFAPIYLRRLKFSDPAIHSLTCTQPSILHQSLATNVGNKLLWSHIRPVYLLHIWFKQSTDQSCELNKWILWLLLFHHWPLNWSYRSDRSDWLFYLLGNNRFLFMNDFILFFDNLLVSCTATPSFDLYSSLWLGALDFLLLVDVGFSLD